ncbi:transglycosylase SLT domain-containing protein, partial [Salmonella enterica]|nr:transglycosylase SLT domain-containing protein [Salmonella enterica]
PELGKLSDAFSGAIETVLKSPELGKWIDGLSQGIKDFADYLSSGEIRQDFDRFMVSIRKIGITVDRVIKFIEGDYFNKWQDSSSAADWIENKTGFDPRSIGRGTKNFLAAAAGLAPMTYDTYFEEAAKKYGLDPMLLKAVAGAESSWDQNAVSKAGALGLMQVMPDNFQPGENPFDPRDNIMAGARVMSWAKSKAGDDVEEMLRWYNGGKNRGSKENREYAGRVNEQYRKIYGSDMPGTSTSNPVVQPVQQSSGKTDQILQQILDNQKRGHAQGLVVYNNTGGNAIVSSTQLGGFG